MVDIAKLDAVLDHIEKHPEEWDQNVWGRKTDCGTAFCLAGHLGVHDRAAMEWGQSWDGSTELRTIDGQDPGLYGAGSLDLDSDRAVELFHALNSLNVLKAMRDALAEDPATTGDRLYGIADAHGDRPRMEYEPGYEPDWYDDGDDY